MGIARSGSWAPDISHWFPSGTDGQAEGRTYGHVITIISRVDRLPNFLRCGVTLAHFARAWSSSTKRQVVIKCTAVVFVFYLSRLQWPRN